MIKLYLNLSSIVFFPPFFHFCMNKVQKSKDVSDGNFDTDNVTELVDRLESAVDSMSKGEPEAFDGLVAILSVFLPMTLYMADEVKMLRVSIKTGESSPYTKRSIPWKHCGTLVSS